MKSDLFHRYVWLVDVVRHAKKITYEEIAKQWLHSELNVDGSPMVLRTFHNHREAIEHLFGIRIVCDRLDGNRYFIAESRGADSTRLKVWMLQTLSISRMMSTESTMRISDRILLDTTPEEKFGLSTLIEAIKANEVVYITYRRLGEREPHRARIEPYSVRLTSHKWYLLGRDADNGRLVVIALNQVVSIERTDSHFIFPDGFSPREFFLRFYGSDIDDKSDVQIVRLKMSATAADELRHEPLHPSQREIVMPSEDGSALFEYRIVPTEDFKKAILAFGDDAEVISPQSLREEISYAAQRILRRYAQVASV